MSPLLVTCVALLPIILSFGAAAPGQGRGDREAGLPFASRSPVVAKNGMACTSQPLATMVAIDVLKRGGSAVDAAIAANAALALMEPTGCGLGGDLFALVWDPKSRKLHGLNASGRSPRALTAETLKERLGDRREIPLFGPLPISVPGCVSGWKELHERFGRLERARILGPAIAYAREGFPLSQAIARGWAMNFRRFEAEAADIGSLEPLRKLFLVGGKVPREGDLFRNPDLARTLEILAEDGFAAFYGGPLADRIADSCQKAGGCLSREDLAQHQAEWVEPLATDYRGTTVWELPPNGQGLAALQILNILETFDLAALGPGSAAALHLQIEAKKLAFEDRARFYADPAFTSLPLTGSSRRSTPPRARSSSTRRRRSGAWTRAIPASTRATPSTSPSRTGRA